MKNCKESWVLNEIYCEAGVGQQFSNVENVFLCQGEQVVHDKISEVIRFNFLSKTYYIKRYIKSGNKSFCFFRKSRICKEWENLVSLTKIGLPVPNIVAHGETVQDGFFLKGALITEGVKCSDNLAHYLTKNSEQIKNKKWLYFVIDQVAKNVAKMHENKFIHRDLNLRNILVTSHEFPVIYFIDCPSGGFKQSIFLRRGIVRDLAHLDKVARYLLSNKDLLYFYKKYKGTNKLTVDDKKLIAQIRHFHDKHRAKQNRKAGKYYRVI